MALDRFFLFSDMTRLNKYFKNHKKKHQPRSSGCLQNRYFQSAPSGARTLDTLIKSYP